MRGGIEPLSPHMRILIVYAHPEPDSLTGALKDVAVEHLRGAGHEVVVSDLYAMGWKAQADAADFGESGTGTFMQASGEAYSNGTLTADITAEQDKLRWADAVLLHFPLWWYSMPAILKGWVDRVFTNGFAYGSGSTALPRYGAGALSGRRAMLVVSIGGREPAYSERGINGHIDDLLFPIHHGILYYPGMDIAAPVPRPRHHPGRLRTFLRHRRRPAGAIVADRRDRADPVPHPGRRRLRPQPATAGRLGLRRDRIRAAPRRLRCAPG